jgi:hypothetical protein
VLGQIDQGQVLLLVSSPLPGAGGAIRAHRAAPLPSPLLAHDFHGYAQHGRASTSLERPGSVGFQCPH